jgi:DNA-directed RNA polymerase I subunit RPA1
LLEHGLLEAALGVDDLGLRVRRPTDDDNDAPEESPEAFQQRVDLFVRVHLARASTSKRDDYKNTLVYQTRKDLISEFLKATITRKCNNNGCNA